MRWTIALVTFFLVLFLADGTLIWLAVSGAEPVAPSYATEPR